jgi:hypothetical protein
VSCGPQHWSPQLTVAGSPQHVSPAQPLAGGLQAAEPHRLTRSVQTLSKQLPEQHSNGVQHTLPFASPQWPSAQHCRPSGHVPDVQVHCPFAVQTSSIGHEPQSPSQPSKPHCLPAQSGWQRHSPLVGSHSSPGGQLSGVQPHVPVVGWQTSLPVHVRQAAPATPHCSSVGGEMQGPVAVSQQPSGHVCAVQAHTPSKLHSVPGPHCWQFAPSTPQVASEFGWH